MNRKLTVVDLVLVVYVFEHRLVHRLVQEMELGSEIGFERGVELEIERRRKYRENQELFEICCHFWLVISLNNQRTQLVLDITCCIVINIIVVVISVFTGLY